MECISVSNGLSDCESISDISTGQAASNIGGRLFAVIGIGTKDVKVNINFGHQPFIYEA
jgi:hypothetical protein